MTADQPDTALLGPVESQERILLLDVLRAVAILGMFYANFAGTTHPDIPYEDLSAVERSASFFLSWFVRYKFWPLFALLMGVGMGVQLERADTRGRDIIPIYLRRLLSLFVIAWLGSPLFTLRTLEGLAVAGLVAFFIGYPLRRHRRLLLLVTVWVFLGNSLPSIVGSYNSPISDPPPAEQVEETVQQQETRSPRQEALYQRRVEQYEQRVEEAIHIQSPFRGDLETARRILKNRTRSGFLEEFRSLQNLVTAEAELIHFMLFGFFLWQIGLFKRTWERKRFFVYLFFISGIVGSWPLVDAYLITARTPIQNALGSFFYFFPVAMDLAYVSLVALLLSATWSSRFVKKLAPAGRMAFTNYFLHFALPPVLFPLLFGWWLPGVGRAENMAKVTVVFAILVVFSTWWLKRFRFGPFEWLWRSLTYWRFQPMRVERPSQT